MRNALLAILVGTQMLGGLVVLDPERILENQGGILGLVGGGPAFQEEGWGLVCLMTSVKRWLRPDLALGSSKEGIFRRPFIRRRFATSSFIYHLLVVSMLEGWFG